MRLVIVMFKVLKRCWTAVALAVLLTACMPIAENYGYVPLDEDLEALVVGVTTKAEVVEAIGQPAVRSERYGEAWFYVANRVEQRGFFAPQETDRQVVAVSFSEGGDEALVANVARYTLQDGRAVTLSRRVTESNLGQITVIQQLLRSLGRIDPTSAFGN